MLYTVKEMAALSGVTIKTLHYYHKIGLLVPHEISAAGYRLYSQAEVERLQQILFFRELDFSLEAIREHMDHGEDRVNIMTQQRGLLLGRMRRLERLIQTLDESIGHTERHEVMDNQAMFAGFNEEQWQAALKKQSDYLKATYDFDLLKDKLINADEMNASALEVINFQQTLAQLLRDGVSHQDEKVKALLNKHVAFLNAHGHDFDAKSLLAQARFLTGDEFHRKMLEST
ncbi:MAG: MerR family transcriptional regulator, partial [Chloroflexota bacterium]